ncbi:unknown; predicted coding region [Mycoplasmopsis pulmonis]|uniref:Uncharacterized protein n=1 Tax=Mycoplasmopsis pulmonis (strain UAB CTIP) TaxID=272635 RepID=Q98PH5_MYCPU|nr:hypothetical protein [Mycoplasmopsis pulmonis]MDZ7293403.1 hypothetical protein [Mycoplasmopsis pulmonis]CAC13920.1 unknown; predicted coding region [Mycoplasmopsis pulmonis]VEU68515.1 Uncharacterised protein [Mycoplasmopsis pulmonis]
MKLEFQYRLFYPLFFVIVPFVIILIMINTFEKTPIQKWHWSLIFLSVQILGILTFALIHKIKISTTKSKIKISFFKSIDYKNVTQNSSLVIAIALIIALYGIIAHWLLALIVFTSSILSYLAIQFLIKFIIKKL